jgi:hypothetical protein
MDCIKYSERLRVFYSKEEIKQLENGARLLKDCFNCELKILSTNISGAYRAITMQVGQGSTLSGEYFNKIMLEKKIEDLFYPYIDKHIVLYIKVNPYKPTIVDVVTHEWLQEKMITKGIRKSDFIVDTGIDKTNLSAWINGTRSMSQPVKAMFYFYLIRPTNAHQLLTAFYQDLSEAIIGSTIPVVTEFITEADIRSAVLKKARELNCQVLMGGFNSKIAEISFYEPKRICMIA